MVLLKSLMLKDTHGLQLEQLGIIDFPQHLIFVPYLLLINSFERRTMAGAVSSIVGARHSTSKVCIRSL